MKRMSWSLTVITAFSVLSLLTPAGAAGSTHVVDGTLDVYGAEYLDQASFAQGGCSVDAPNGVSAAFLNVRKYAGKTIIVKVGAVDHNEFDQAADILSAALKLIVSPYVNCDITENPGPASSSTVKSPAKIAITNQRYLMISESGWYPPRVGQHFSVWVCSSTPSSC